MWVAAAITGIALLLPRLSNGCESDAENFICGRGTGRHRNAGGISADRVPASQVNHRGPSHPRPVMPLLAALGLFPEGPRSPTEAQPRGANARCSCLPEAILSP